MATDESATIAAVRDWRDSWRSAVASPYPWFWTSQVTRVMHQPVFDNAFVRELPGDPEQGSRRRQVEGRAVFAHRSRAGQRAAPAGLRRARWRRRSGSAMDDLRRSASSPRCFGGNALLTGMQPYAANYGGHQFGNWAGQLGDGRAISLGETVNAAWRALGAAAQGRRA